jgi:hypothetical protein
MSQAYSEATEREVELVGMAKGFFEVYTHESGAKTGRVHGIDDPWAASKLIESYGWMLVDYPGEVGLSIFKLWLE